MGAFHSIEEILAFMAIKGVPNVKRLDEMNKKVLVEMISFRHVDNEEVRNAESSSGFLDPSVFEEPLKISELDYFLIFLGIEQWANKMYEVRSRSRHDKSSPMSLKEVRNMLRIHGFSKCKRLSSFYGFCC